VFDKDVTVSSATFSPDGRSILVLTSHKPYVYVWYSFTGKAVELKGHNETVKTAGFSPDSRQIVTGSNDGSLRVWDSTSGEMLDYVEAHNRLVLHALFSPDGQRIVSTSNDGMVRLWPAFLSTEDLITFTKLKVARCLTFEQRAQFGLDDLEPAWCARLNKWPFLFDPAMNRPN
jgi:WD40 repeat protein